MIRRLFRWRLLVVAMVLVISGGLIVMYPQMPDAPPVEPPPVRLLKGEDDAVYQLTADRNF